MPEDWSYSSSSAGYRHCNEYILPQQDNPWRSSDGVDIRAPHRLRRQASTPRNTPRDDNRDALRPLLEGMTEQLWSDSPSHFEPTFVRCDEALKSLQLQGSNGTPERSFSANGITEVAVGERAMALAKEGAPASVVQPSENVVLQPENAVVVVYQPAGFASPKFLIFCTDGGADQVKLRRAVDALAARALPECYEQNQAAMKIQCQIRNKELRNAVKAPKRALEAVESPGLQADILEPDVKAVQVQAIFAGGEQPVSVDVALCSSSDPAIVDCINAGCTDPDISQIDKMRMWVAVRDVLQLREMCQEAPTTRPMIQALFSNKLVAESSVDECQKSLTDVEGQLKAAGFLAHVGSSDKCVAAAAAQALLEAMSLELKYQQIRTDLLSKGSHAEDVNNMVEQAGAEMRDLQAREEAEKERQKHMTPTMSPDDTDHMDSSPTEPPPAKSGAAQDSSAALPDTPRSHKSTGADSETESAVYNKYRENNNACRMCENQCVLQ